MSTADFDIISGDISVGYTRNLLEVFLGATDFKNKLSIGSCQLGNIGFEGHLCSKGRQQLIDFFLDGMQPITLSQDDLKAISGIGQLYLWNAFHKSLYICGI